MPGNNVFIGFDFYHAGVYGAAHAPTGWPGYESYKDEVNHFHVVVNAYLISIKNTDASEASPDLVEYLKLWESGADISTLNFVTADRCMFQKLSRMYPPDQWEIVPVPLPPGVKIDLELSINQDTIPTPAKFKHSRTLGERNGAFGMEGLQWIKFARANFIEIPIKELIDPKHLLSNQHKVLVEWILSLILSLRQKPDSDLYRNEKKILGFIDDIKSSDLRTYLEDKTNAWEFYKDIVSLDQNEDNPSHEDKRPPKYHPPRLYYSNTKLDEFITCWDEYSEDKRLLLLKALFGQKVEGQNDTYLEFLGTEFLEFSKITSAPQTEILSKVKEGFGGLFGFGERLRWPIPNNEQLGDTQDFMILRPNVKDMNGWFLTNAHSLAGLVFRLGPYLAQTAITSIDNISFSINGTLLKNLDGDNDTDLPVNIGKGLKNLLDDVKTHLDNKQVFKGQIEPGLEYGLLYFRPRALQVEIAKKIKSPEDLQLFRVPSALLDLIDPEPRNAYNPIHSVNTNDARQERFLTRSEPQRLIERQQLYLDGNYLDLYEHMEGPVQAHQKLQPLATFQVSVQRLKLSYAKDTKPKLPVYELRLVNKLHAKDLTFLKGRLDKILESGGIGEAQLWVTTHEGGNIIGTKSFDLAQRELASTARKNDANCQPIYLIVDDETDVASSLTTLMGSAATSGSASTEDGGPSVQFDLVIQPVGVGPFNLLIDKRINGEMPIIHLSDVFITRLSRSAERIQERFDLTLNPSIPAEEKAEEINSDESVGDAITDDFANFKKLRVELKNDNSVIPSIALTYPAAIPPLPGLGELKGVTALDYQQYNPHPWADAGPHFSYWIGHQFTEEIVGNILDEELNGQDDEAAKELGRYVLYCHAGKDWLLEGHIENVYNHRVGVEPMPISLGLSTDIKHIASLSSQEGQKKNALDGEDITVFDKRIAVRYCVNIDENDNESLSIELDKEYAKWVLAEYNNIDEDNKEDRQPGRIRAFYEALADMQHCLDNADYSQEDEDAAGWVKLALERWNFDNTKNITSAGDITPMQERSLPSVVPNLRCVGRAELNVNKESVAGWLSLIKDSFANFIQNLEVAVNNETETLAPWQTISFPVTSADWNWSFGKVDSLVDTTNLVRLGISLRRADKTIVDASFGKAEPILLRQNAKEKEDQLPGPGSDTDIGRDKREILKKDAQKATKNYLCGRGTSSSLNDGSNLHKSFLWLTSKQCVQQVTALCQMDGNADMNPNTRRQRIFGSITEIAHFPVGQRLRVDTEVKLYYVLYALRPIQRHPFFRDARTTQEFLEYLTQLMGDLVTGKHTKLVEFEEEEFASNIAMNHKRDIERYAGNLANILANQFLARVDDVTQLPEPEKTQRLNRIDNDPCLSDSEKHELKECAIQEFNIYKHVNKLADDLENDTDEGSLVALKSLFTRDPNAANWAKGFAIGIFEPETFSDRLYRLRIKKSIQLIKISGSGIEQVGSETHEAKPVGFDAILKSASSAHTIKPLRYFTEALADSVFQHNFRIDNDKGDARAQTAEDVIEGTNSLDAPESCEDRDIRLNVVHYNPEWKASLLLVNRTERYERYLLPSRDAPEAPVAVEPEMDQKQNKDKPGLRINPWYSEIFVQDLPASDLHKRFKERLKPILTTFNDTEGEGTDDDRSNLRLDEKGLIFIAPGLRATTTISKKSLSLAFAQHKKGLQEQQIDFKPSSGWHYIDTYLSHFLFIVNADEEALQGPSTDPMKGFTNDTFEFQVERREGEFETEEPPESSEKEFDAKSGLHGWFHYNRSVAERGAEASEKPPKMTVETVIKELRIWINGPKEDQADVGVPENEHQHLLCPYKPESMEEDRSNNENIITARYSLGQNGEGWQVFVEGLDKRSDAVGSIVAVDALSLQTQKSDGTWDVPDSSRILLRVTVLDDTRFNTRVRARVLRNQVDADGDLDGDINPVFVRTTKYSDWAKYPPYFLLYTEDEVISKFPEAVKYLEVGEDSEAKVDIQTRAGWLSAAPGSYSFGAKLLPNVLSQTFKSDMAKVERYFSIKSAGNPDSIPDKDKFLIDGSIVQILGDHHKRVGDDSVNHKKKIESRHDAVVTQNLRPSGLVDGVRSVNGKLFYTATPKGFELMVSEMYREEIKSADPSMVVSWYDPKGTPLMEINWPIVWEDDVDD